MNYFYIFYIPGIRLCNEADNLMNNSFGIAFLYFLSVFQ